MTSPAPTVSVGLPVFNGDRYLEEALTSLLQQDFEDFELIISDNASTDHTASICTYYARLDERVRYYSSDRNLGAAANYNRVFAAARGRYFKWAAHDDICEPQFIRRCIDTFAATSANVVLVYPRARFIDGEGQIIRDDADQLETRAAAPQQRFAHVLRHVSSCNAIFGLMRADALRRTRLIDGFIASDVVLFAELAMLGEFCEVPDRLLLRRIHSGASRKANPTTRQATAWFDPERARATLVLPRDLRLTVEYARSVHHMPLPVAERLACYARIPQVFLWRRLRVVGGQYKRRMKRLWQ